jgi:hypothetical protein
VKGDNFLIDPLIMNKAVHINGVRVDKKGSFYNDKCLQVLLLLQKSGLFNKGYCGKL